MALHRSHYACRHGIHSLEDSVAQLIQYHDPETALILLESAVDQGQMSPEECWRLISKASKLKQRTLKFFTPGAQSGSETRVRLFLQKLRRKVSIQVKIPEVGRVDILDANKVIFECDSFEHHQANYHVDRARDLHAIDAGYQTIRLSYRQIWYEWEETKQILRRRLIANRKPNS